MSFLATALVLLIATGTRPAGDAPVVRGPIGARLDDALARFEAFGFSGAVLAARGDDVLLAKGYGLADRERGVPVGELPPETTDVGPDALREHAGRYRLAEGGELEVSPGRGELLVTPLDPLAFTTIAPSRDHRRRVLMRQGETLGRALEQAASGEFGAMARALGMPVERVAARQAAFLRDLRRELGDLRVEIAGTFPPSGPTRAGSGSRATATRATRRALVDPAAVVPAPGDPFDPLDRAGEVPSLARAKAGRADRAGARAAGAAPPRASGILSPRPRSARAFDPRGRGAGARDPGARGSPPPASWSGRGPAPPPRARRGESVTRGPRPRARRAPAPGAPKLTSCC